MQQPAARVPWNEIAYDGTRTTVKTLLFILVGIAFILPGLIGHDPWKPDEAVNFGFIYHILQSGDWVLPRLAGDIHLDRPPLYFVIAAFFAKAFSWLLPVHDAARLATGFFMALVMLFVALAARTLHGHRNGRMAVLLLIGCLGLLVRSHEMISDVALLSGIAMACFGLAKSRISGFVGGFAIGTGVGIGFMSKGFIAPLMVVTAGAALSLAFREWRTPRFLQAWAVALVAALPWFTLWPLALYKRAPELFQQWLSLQNPALFFNSGLERGVFNTLLFYLNLLPWYAWPALPLAAWTLWHHGRRGLHIPALQMPLMTFIVFFFALSFAPQKSDVSAIVLLIPLALLATPGIDYLRRGAASALDWFGMMTFGFFAFVMWLWYAAMFAGFPEKMAKRVVEYQPGFTPQFHALAFVLAFALTIIWLFVVWHTRRNNRRAVVNWAAGITMFWVLAMALWLPYIDHGRSYRSVMTELGSVLPKNAHCIASKNIGDGQRALLHYYLSLITKPQERGENNCKMLLVQDDAKQEAPQDARWKKIWEGSRPGDRHEKFRLYQRQE